MEMIKNILHGNKDDEATNTGTGPHSSTTGAGTHSSTTGTGAHSSTTGTGTHSSTTDTGTHSSTTGTGTHTGQSRATESGTQAETGQKEHGVLRQLLNPAGDKYDEVAYGAPTGNEGASNAALGSSSTGGQGRKASVVDTDNMGQLRTEPEVDKHEHGVLRQILNPHGKKYDEEGYGTTASEAGSAGVPGTTSSNLKETDTTSLMSVKSGKLGPYASNTDGEALGSEQGTTTGTSHLGRDAALGAGVGAVGGAGYEANKHHNDPSTTHTTTSSQPQSAVGGQSTAERSFPLAGGATTTGSSVDPYSTASTSRTGPETGAFSSGSGIPDRTAQTTSTNQSSLGRDAAIAGGVGAGALGAGTMASHEGGRAQDSALPDIDRSSAFGSTNPTSSDLVGGSSTTAPGSTPYNTRDATASSASTAPSTGASSGNALGTTHNSHLGRDAAIGTGVGAAGGAGLAGYESSRQTKQDTSSAAYGSSGQGNSNRIGGHHDDETPDVGYVHHTHGPHATDTANRLDPHVPGEFPTESGDDRHKLGNREAAVIGGTGIGAANLANLSRDNPSSASTGLDSSTPGVSSASTTQPGRDNHHGRDQALGAGAGLGAAGLGTAGYEAVKSHDQPSQSLSGQPSTSTTTTDPSTTSSALPTQSGQQSHHYGRDAAVVGGAGAGAAGLGAAGYEASRHRDAPSSASTAQPSTFGSQSLEQRSYESSQPNTASTAGYGNTSTSSSAPLSNTTDAQQHHGRDAALTGGAGIAGAGAYEAAQGRSDTAQASASGGPHDSSVANTLDPRVQSQPKMTTDHNTSTTSYSDPIRSQQQRDETHYGHDAAVAGGAGGVGAGAYEAAEHHDMSGEHSHSKLHKKEDPRGPTGASAVIQDRHDHRLQEAREAEAAKHREHADGEKKPSLISRILHPGGHKHDHESTENSGNVTSSTSAMDTATPTSRTHIGNDSYQAPSSSSTGGISQTGASQGQEGIVNDPHTGLPMNVGKYGTGQGGTDGASNIGGYNENAPGGASADWDKIKKANTPY